jgi:bifunctional non-homologous end joining protein LigD
MTLAAFREANRGKQRRLHEPIQAKSAGGKVKNLARTMLVPRPERREGGGAVSITHRDRVIFPEAGITKGEVADYYAAAADSILPWLTRRPVSLVRCPEGRDKECFFQKHDTGNFGEHVKSVEVREKDGTTRPYIFIESAEGLLACAQMGAIEFHGWGSRVDDLERPDRLVFDLDPDDGAEFEALRGAAFEIRDELERIGLVSFPMVTGGKGLHLFAPIEPGADWATVKDFATRFAGAEAIAHPTRFTDLASKAHRRKRLFIDYLRNTRGATAIAPYSLRARPGAPVAAPVTWDELALPEGPIQWHIQDLAELKRRAASKELASWGRARQDLPQV